MWGTRLMKIVSLILVSLLLINCSQNQQKEKAKSESFSDSLTVETVDITDSTKFDNYTVVVDTTYFYARPDSNPISGAYLTKNQLTLICCIKDGFGYAARLTDSIAPIGWLRLRDLKQIYFTPPRIANE
jgi:hypothetical protein